MPDMANITVKNASNADVVFVAKSASPGDGSFAQWQTAGVSPATSGSLRVKTTDNGNKSARVMSLSGAIPEVAVVDGVSTVVNLVPISLSLTIPKKMATAQAIEATTTLLNACASSLIKEVATSGYAPT